MARDIDRPVYADFSLLKLNRFSLHIIFLIPLLLAVSLAVSATSSLGAELQTEFATLVYQDKDVLRQLNDNLFLGRKLGYQIRQYRIVTLEDEVRSKVDLIVSKAKTVLDMPVLRLKFTIMLYPDQKGVRDAYRESYGGEVDYLAFYSISRKTMHLAADTASLQVLSHEVGHVIVDHYFKIRPPYRIHEVMAQYCEMHIND